jgi:hypothetical protein
MLILFYLVVFQIELDGRSIGGASVLDLPGDCSGSQLEFWLAVEIP